MNPLHELELGSATEKVNKSSNSVVASKDGTDAEKSQKDYLSSYHEQLINSYAPFIKPSWSGWNIPDQKVIRAFNIIKVIYIFMLIPYHITVVANVVTNNRSYPSYDLPYPTTDHGLEYMAGLLFISGWLSHATTKPGTTFIEQMKKKLLRLLPTYYIGAIPLTLFCILYEAAVGKLNGPSGNTGIAVEFVLELFTFGSWNPALLFWTRNRPLWFISVLLTYHYCSTYYLTWVRGSSFNTVASTLLLFVVTRFAVACIILVCIVQVTIIHIVYKNLQSYEPNSIICAGVSNNLPIVFTYNPPVVAGPNIPPFHWSHFGRVFQAIGTLAVVERCHLAIYRRCHCGR